MKHSRTLAAALLAAAALLLVPSAASAALDGATARCGLSGGGCGSPDNDVHLLAQQNGPRAYSWWWTGDGWHPDANGDGVGDADKFCQRVTIRYADGTGDQFTANLWSVGVSGGSTVLGDGHSGNRCYSGVWGPL